MKNYALITGGFGFVGYNLANKLLNLGKKIIIVDNLYNTTVKKISGNILFFKLDLSKKTSLYVLEPHKIDVIYHLAAQSSNATSFNDPIEDLNYNQIATYNLLEYASKRQITRFIYTSSMSVYGNIHNHPTIETTEKKPDSFYGIHKLVGEYYCNVFNSYMGINFTVFRLFSVYGHGQNIKNLDQGLLSIYLGYILNGKELIVKGSGERERDMIHVEDVTDVLIKSVNNTKTFNQTYNLGYGKSFKIKTIINLLLKVFEKEDFKVKYEKETKGDPFKTQADINKLKKDLDWTPKISPIEGITNTALEYQQK